MLTKSSRTLAKYLRGSPMYIKVDISDLKLKDFTAFYKDKKWDLACPNASAVSFYYYNHLLTNLRLRYDESELLPEKYEEVLNMAHSCMYKLAGRMIWYIYLICTRESRHTHKHDLEFNKKYVEVHGKNVFEFWQGLSGSSGAAHAGANNPPDTTLGNYIDSLVYNFKGGHAGGYAGPKWGHVAKCLQSFVHGKTSAEACVDTAFTLCHNNGPIFNKGMTFGNIGSYFIELLDIQRSGQIPKLVNNLEAGILNDVGHYIEPNVKNVHEWVKKDFDDFNGQVDWVQVKEAGGVSSSLQYYVDAYKKKYMIKETPKPKTIANGKYLVVEPYRIQPGTYVNKLKRKKVA